MQFTQNPAVSETRPGGKLMMFNGLIEGEYVSLEQNKKIEMKWKFKDWGEKYADVTIDFEEDEDEVRIQFHFMLFESENHLTPFLSFYCF